MYLCDGKSGFAYLIKKINLSYKTKHYLEILGLTEKTLISIFNRKDNGSVVIKVRGTKLALGKNITKYIEIGGTPYEK